MAGGRAWGGGGPAHFLNERVRPGAYSNRQETALRGRDDARQHSIGVKCPVNPPAFPYNWYSAAVAHILDRQEYTGDTVNFRSFSRSFKQKKRLNRP